jgi:hypothetical protein
VVLIKEKSMPYDVLNSNETQDMCLLETPKENVNNNESPEAKPSGSSGIKLFSCCSKSLKRFSIMLFIINIFVAIGIMGALIISLFFKVGLQMLGFLAFPLVTVFIILLIIARFISALVYGFAEIVEKSEKK